jgi:hypothetical protein
MYRCPSTQKDHSLSHNQLQHKGRICSCIYWIVFNTLYYTALCKFSFEIQESSLSDTRSCCGDTFFMTSWYWNAGKDIQHKQKDCSMYIPLTDWCTTNSVIFPFPSTSFLYFQQLYGPVHEQFSTFFRKNCSQKLFSDIESNWTVNVTFLRSCTKGSPSLKYLLILISIHVYCLNCGFIEMLDNLITITYTEYWYITYTEYWYITYTEYWYTLCM